MILAIIIVGFIAVAYVMCEKKRAVRQAEEQAEKERKEKERKELEYEQEARRQIQEAASKIPGSVLYRELLSSLKNQIETDAKLYFTWAYDEYIKTPGAAPEKFRTYLAKAYSEHEKSSCAYKRGGGFEPFPDRKGMTLTSVEYTVTPDGVYANPFNGNYRVHSGDWQYCEFQFNYGKHGYSNLSQVQVWALAQTLGRDLGYEMTMFRSGNSDYGEGRKEGIYRKKIEENPGQEYYIDLQPEGKTGYLAQVVESEIRRVQASGVSYRSPF